MTANESQTSSAVSGSLNANAIAQQADAALSAVGDKVSDLTGQNEAVSKVVTGLQENVLGVQHGQSNEKRDQDPNESATVAKEEVSNVQVEEFLRHQYRSNRK